MRFGIGIGIGVAIGVLAVFFVLGAVFGLFDLASIASGERQKGEDAAARALVRNGMTAVESAYVDTRDFSALDTNVLASIEPSIDFVYVGSYEEALHPQNAKKGGNTLYFYSNSAYAYGIGTRSATGHTFAAWVHKDVGGGTHHFVDGEEARW